MPVEPINIENFLTLSRTIPILDVRSPAEYAAAHIPGAFTLPLFSDEQRKIIGTAYKKESREIAVNIGLNYFSERMKKIPKEVVHILNDCTLHESMVSSAAPGSAAPALLIHCWRGGMRSGTVAWLLSLYGYKIYVLTGGYKSFRNRVLAQFEKKYFFKMLGGYTGSGKTEILKEMQRQGKRVIDLEGLANHKGSAFGALGERPQPSQEMFENLLAVELWRSESQTRAGETNQDESRSGNETIWLEDESRNIGGINIPKGLWEQMRTSPLYFLHIPFEERLNHIVSKYGSFTKKELVTCISQLQKRLGGSETKNAVNYLMEDKTKECFAILMQYYDKVYGKAVYNREGIEALLRKIPCDKVEVENWKSLF